MIGGRIVIPGTITNTALPVVTENSDYDAIAKLPGLVHFCDWASSKRLATSPLSCAEHVSDVAYTRKTGGSGNPSFSTIGSGDAVLFVSGSEITSGVNVNYASDFSLAFAINRDATSSAAASWIIGAFSPSTEQAQFYAAATTNTVTFFSATLSWSGSTITGTIAPGDSKVVVIAYKASTKTITLYLNGVASGTVTVNTAMSAGLLYLGRTTLMKLGHLFVFNTNLADTTSATTRSYVTTYLGSKHGITV